MEIQGKTIDIDSGLHYLAPVTYVPQHANNNPNSEFAERGVIISTNELNVKVLYCNSRTVQSTRPEDLVWG